MLFARSTIGFGRGPVVLGVSLVGVSLLGACQSAKQGGAILHCADGDRTTLDCDAEISYQGVNAQGGVHVLNVASLGTSFSETALRQVNEDVERYVAGQTRLCREYNSCIVDGATYHAEAAKDRDHLVGFGPLVEKYQGATSSAERASSADAIYAHARGQAEVPLSFRMGLQATLPVSAGGKQLVVPPNYPLPTGTVVWFDVETSRDAFFYIFQVNAKKEVSVLFPNAGIQTQNPLSSASPARIPPDRHFRLDENGVGTEKVYIVASLKPIEALDSTLRRFADGSAKVIDQDGLLSSIGEISPGAPPSNCAGRTRDLRLEGSPSPAGGDGCVRSRGLVLDDAPVAGGAVDHSLAARAATGDDTVAKVFPFQHVTESAYAASLSAYQAPTEAGARARGIVIENWAGAAGQ